MKKLTLDFLKWRSGGVDPLQKNPNETGKGATNMCNDENFMCCLGQFSRQIDPEITNDDLLRVNTPAGVSTRIKRTIPGLSKGDFLSGYKNTTLSFDAIKINDDSLTTPQEKIYALKTLFNSEGFEIEVINQP